MVGAAAVVLCVDAIGWWQWSRAVALLAQQPEAGADALATRSLLSLPPAVVRSRRLPARDLAGASRRAAVAAMVRLGTLQLGQVPTDPDGPKNLARAALLEEDVAAARRWLQEALDRDPTSPYVHRLAALAARAVGQEEQVRHHLAQAHALEPGLRRPVVELAPEDEQWVRLEGLRRRVALSSGRRLDDLLALAAELRRAGRHAEAAAVLAPMIDEPQVILVSARWALEEGENPPVAPLVALAERTALPAPMRAQALSLLARVRLRSGDPAGAAEAAQEALRLVPSSPEPYLALARLAVERGDLDEAVTYVRRAWGVASGDVRVLLRLADLAEKAGRLDDARLALERATELAPGRPDVAARLVDLHLREGDPMRAAMVLSRALDRSPMDSRLLALAERLHRSVGMVGR